MKNIKLDEIDIKILSILQSQGRISNLEISKQIGLSPPPCLRRIRLLEQNGYIRSYQANLASEKLGYNVVVFAFITLTTQQQDVINECNQQFEKIKYIRESYLLSGEFDYVLKIVARSWEHYNEILSEHLLKNKNIANVRSSLAVNSIKSKPETPID